jgi:D-aspartate ligase
MKKVPAVLTPNSRLGIAIARSLGKQGIPVYAIGPDTQALVGKSKYCQSVVSPDPAKSEEDYLQFMIEWGKTLGGKAVLYPVDDEAVLLVSRERERLRPYYEWVMPDDAKIVNLSTKAGLVAAAQECGVPAPRTVAPRDAQDVEAIAREMTYPVVLKPIESVYWYAPEIAFLLRESLLSGQAKVRLCNDASELVQAYRAIAAHDDRMIIQEVVTGPVTNGCYTIFYLDRQSKPLAMFTGRKMRTLPMGFGSSCYVRSCRDPELDEVVLRLLSGVRYQGLGGLEFKKDPRDGLYKVIEFNTRFGLWDGLGVRCGVDSPYIAYRDTLHLPVEPQLEYREDVIWFDWQRDVRAFLMYNRQGQLTLGEWLRSLRGERMWAIYSRDDWRPGVQYTINLFRTLLTKLVSKQRP